MENNPDQFFAEVRDLYLPLLTQYHDDEGDEPTYPWISNWKLGLQAGYYTDLEAAVSAEVYPVRLFERSRTTNREHGYALWDFIIRNGRTKLRQAHDQGDARAIIDSNGSFGRSLNGWWLQHVGPAYIHGTVDDLPYVRNFMKTDWFLVEAAHALAHRFGDDQLPALSFWRSYTYLSKIFLQYLAELYLASEFGIPIDIHQPPGRTLAWGVVGHPTIRYGFESRRPVLQTPYTYSIVPDQHFAHACVSFEIGADPLPIIVPGAGNQPEDRLAYQPKRLFFVGWTLSSWLYCQELRWPERLGWAEQTKAAFTSLCEDLFAPHWFNTYLEAAKREAIGYTVHHRRLEDWTDDLRNLIAMTSMLPCDNCLLFNGGIENGIKMAPKKWSYKTADPKELKEYRQKLKQALRLVVKANAEAYGRDYRRLRRYRKGRHKDLRRTRRSENCQKKDLYGYSR
jgi:hypothetical protein